LSALGLLRALTGHHEGVTAVEHENAISLRQLVFQIVGGAARIDPLAVVVTDCRLLALLESLHGLGIRLAGGLAAFLQPIEQRRDGHLGVGFQAERNSRKPAERILAVIDLNNFLAVFEDLAEVRCPFIQARTDDHHRVAVGQGVDRQGCTQPAADAQMKWILRGKACCIQSGRHQRAKIFGQFLHLRLGLSLRGAESAKNGRPFGR
jgi:hypothetical protein